jgi:hypothetical protein
MKARLGSIAANPDMWLRLMLGGRLHEMGVEQIAVLLKRIVSPVTRSRTRLLTAQGGAKPHDADGTQPKLRQQNCTRPWCNRNH